MRNSNLPQSIILALFLFVNTLSFSNNFNKSVTINKELSGLFAPIITSYSPTSGTAGTVVTITGSGFTNATNITIGVTPIAVQFVSPTELKIIIPCGLASGDLAVDGISAGAFTYISPTLSTSLGNLSYCDGTSVPVINLAGTPSGTTFNWTNSNTSIGLVVSESNVIKIPTFTATNSTLEPITSTITVTPSINGCLGQSVDYTITVNPKPFATPITNISVCSGANVNQINLTATSPISGTGTSYSWSGTNNSDIGLNTSSGTTSPIPAFTAVNSTSSSLSSVFTVTPTYETCIGNPINFTINVAPQSNGGTLSGSASVCSGQNSGSLSVSGIIGSIVRWEQSTDGTNWTPIANTSAIAIYTSGPLTTTTLFRVAVQNSTCPIAYSNAVTVTVNSLPIITGNLTVCSGATTALTGSGTAASTNAWSSSNTSIASVSSTGLVTGISAGAPIITYTNSNGCKSTTTITVNALPTKPTLSAIHPDCLVATGTIQFSGLPTSGNWTINPGGHNGSGATYSLSNQLPGTYTFSVSDSNLCASLTSTITINAAPIIPAIPSVGTITQPTCTIPSGSVVLNGLPLGNWTITELQGGQTYSNTTSSKTIDNLAPGIYSFTVSNGLCTSAATGSVTINSVPTQSAPVVGTIVQPTCTTSTGSVTLNSLPTGNWTLTRFPDGVKLSGFGTTKTIIGLAPETYNYTVTNSDGCISPISNVILIDSQPVSPVAPVANAQSFLTTDNATVFNLVIASSGTPTWYANPVTVTAIPISTLLVTGTYYASQTTINGCESTGRTPVTVSVFPPSSGGSVSGTTTVCSGTNATGLSLSGFTGSIIKWQSSTVWDFSANVNDINVQSATYTATNLTTPLYFRAVVQSGSFPVDSSSPAFIDVTAQSIGGNLLTSSNTNSTSICLGQNSGLLSVSGYTGTIIRWEQSIDSGVNWISISNISDTYTSGALLATTQYRVVVQNGVCPEICSTVVTISIKDTPVIPVLSNQLACIGETKVFGTSPGNAAYDYKWISNSRTLPNNIFPTISILFDQAIQEDITLTISPKDLTNKCVVSGTFTVATNLLPAADVSIDKTICVGNPIFIGANSVSGSTYSWTSTPAGFTSTSSNPSVNPAVTTTYILEETIAASGCKNSNQVEVSVQPIPVITIVGSPQFHICETTTQVQLNASITNPYASFVWTKIVGSGTFDLPNVLNPVYSPSVADVLAGSVTLRLSVIGANPCVATYTQDVVILIDKKPIANAGSDVITCGTNPIQINAIGTLNATSLAWTLPSGITGTLDQSNPYIPIFTPSANDVNYVGSIEISLVASSNTTCPSSPDTVSVLIIPAPVVDAGPPTATICEGSTYIVPFNPMASQNIVNSTILWTKGTGDGTFSNINSLTPTYTPGLNDIATGTVTLTLSASGNNPCSTPATDSIILTIVKKPTVDLGVDKIVCQGPVNIYSNIQNAGTIQWTINGGSGSFVDSTVSSPIYNPDPVLDKDKNITFTVKVTPKNACGLDVTDSVIYKINATPVVIAGGNSTICETQTTFNVTSTTNDTDSVIWTSTGTGSFDNPNSKDATYTFSPGDITAGSVIFTIRGDKYNCPSVTDAMTVTIRKNPITNITSVNSICQGETVFFTATALNSSSVNWTKESGSGTINNSNKLFASYVSNPNESGTINFRIEAQAMAPCDIPSNFFKTVTVVAKPTADAGISATICQGEDYTIGSTASASNYSGLNWTSSGSGIFIGGTTLNPIYRPSASDINTGSVRLKLTAEKNQPCFTDAVDEMILTINKKPVVSVVYPSQEICTDETVPVIISGPGDSFGVSAENYDSLSWSSSSGNNSGFSDPTPDYTSVANTYLPSAADIANGSVILTLRAIRGVSPGGCNAIDENTIILNFIKKPIINAGADTFICENATYTTTTATAINHKNVVWTSNGTPGRIANPTNLNSAIYSPSASDLAAGSVILRFTAEGYFCQPFVIDEVTIRFKQLPVITVPADVAMCADQNSYPIGGVSVSSVSDYDPTSIDWSSTGTGTFLPSGNLLNPIYKPSNDDIAAGSVELTIKVNSITPCATSVSETFELSFQKLPVASAGSNFTTCALPFQITSATADLTTVSSLVWSTSGTGTFDYENILNPIYTPSAADILSVNPIILKLIANPIAPCADPLESFIDVTLIKTPIITIVTPHPSICEDETNVLVNGTGIQYYDKIKWTSTTGTTISNDDSLTPLVTPSAADKAKKSIELTLTVTPLSPCATELTRKIIIPIQLKPAVNAGASQTICEGNVITTSDALTSNVTNVRWSSSINPGAILATSTVFEYTPSAAEISSGRVLLTLTADAIAPCFGTVSSTVEHLITKNPVINVNPTVVSICESQISYQVPLSQITVENPSSIQSIRWTTTNQLKLTGENTFTPTYTFTQADIDNGSVVLTATITPIAPCATQIIETITLNIFKKATIDATQTNYTFCENTPKPLRAVFANHNPGTRSWRVVSGGGSITPPTNSDNPTYNPDGSSSIVVIEVSVASNTPCTEVVTEQFTLNVIKNPIVTFAKTADIICNTKTTYDLDVSNVTITNDSPTTTYRWSKSVNATGNFVDANDKHTIYNFSAADLASSTAITLTLEAESGDGLCTLTDTESIEITIKPLPTVTITSPGVICEGNVYNATATATNENSVEWTTEGSADGIFGDADSNVATYTPGSNDSAGFTLKFTATGASQCASVSATKSVVIQKLPTIDAGPENRTNCASEPFKITGVIPANTGSITWTSSSSSGGVNSGTFSNPTIKDPIYTPSAAEIALGTPIRLRVSATGIAPCSVTVSDFIILNLEPIQDVNAGIDQTICEGSKVSLAGSATNASSVNWTSSGDGTFSVPNSLTPDYIPGTSDLINGTVTLTLHAISDTNCPEVTDSTVITIVKKPTANAGANVSVCEGSSYTLSAGEASAQNYASISWSATGPGTLDSSTVNSLTPTYNPAPGQTGIVTLTLTAKGFSECNIDAVSSKTITIIAKPVVLISPPSSITICQGEPLSITNVDAQNYSALTWTSSNGLGSFAPNNSVATTYTPLANQSGTVILKLTATALNTVCTNAFSEVAVTIIPSPIVNAGLDASICETATHTISGASVPLGAIFNWTITGPATISSGIGTTEPVITPNLGASGAVTLTLTVQGTLQCPIDVSDSVTITVFPEPTVDAGSNQTACEGVAFIALSGTATNGSSYAWSTNGSGSIQASIDPLQAKYTPGSSDYINPSGVTTITNYLTAIGANGCSNVVKSMTVTLYAKPKVNAGIDLLACQSNNSVLLNGASVSNYNSNYTVTWSSSGNGTFDYISSNGGINPVYNFGTNEPSSVTLTMSVLPNGICPQVAVTDSMVITIHQNPTIVASSNLISMCGETFTMPDLVTVTNSASILWTNTTGGSGTTGTLTNATTETPIFSPSANEIANGFALLTLTALPQLGCLNTAITSVTVNLQPKAIVIAGANIIACQGETVTVNNGASVQNYTTYSWSENGTGTIDPATINTLHPKYIPGTNETGVVTFTLQAANLSPCIGTVAKTMTLTISAQPTVNAGPDTTICQNTNYTLGNATASNATSISWSSSQNSDGTSNSSYSAGGFSNPAIINPSYTPSLADINLGYVYLTVRANSSVCNTLVTDVIKISISKVTTVAAGSNATICESSDFTLAEASATNASSFVWTSSQNSNGTSSPTYISGSFSSKFILNPIYTPSLDDINLGNVYLTLTGSGGVNCPNASSQIVLNIVKKPTVSTTDVQMCMSTPQIILNGVATNYQSLDWTVYSGPGSISQNASNPLNPTFNSNISGLTTEQYSVIRLVVNPNPGCPQSTAVYSDLNIKIQPLPTVKAGDNGAVCYNSGQPIALFTINGTSVTNANLNTLNWTSSGPGLFILGNPVLFQSLSSNCTSETLTLTAKGIGACSTETVSDYVTLKINCTQPSLGPIVGTSTLCQGTSSELYTVAFDSNIQTYNWQVPTGATIVSGQGSNSITVDYGANAVSGTVSVNGINACGSVISTLPITINALPTGTTITGAQTVCAGDTNVAYTAAAIANASSYTWSVPSGVTILSGQGTNSIQVSITSTATSGNVSVIGNNTCGAGTVSSALPITINPQPSLSSTLTPTAICSELVFNYFPTSATLGTTFTWTRAVQSGISNPAAFGSSSINEILVNTTTTPNVVSVSYQITTTTTQGCTNTQTVIATVNPSPGLNNSIPPPAGICSGSLFDYTPTSATGTVTWLRKTVSGIVETTSSNSGQINEVLTNSTSLPITVTYELAIPANTYGCTNTSSANIQLIVNPIPQVSVNNATICAGSIATLTATPSTAGTYSYTWTVPAGVSNPGNTASFSATVAGTYSVIITNTATNCISSSASGIVNVNPIPTVTLNSATICAGNTATLTATPTSIGTYSYAWTVPTGATNPGNTNSITSGIAGTYSVIITNTATNCSSSIVSGTITVNPLPIVSVNNAAICSGASATITATPITAGSYSYSWTVPSGVASPGNVSNFTTTVAGAYSVIITNSNTTCSSTSASGTVTVNPLPVVTVNNATICAGSSATLTASPSTAGTYSYAWTVPAGVTNPGNTASFSATVAGTYSVIITNTATNCISSSASGNVTVNPIPTVTLNSATICAGNTTTLTAIPTSAGTYSYSWTVLSGAINPGNANSITSGIAGTYSVIITDSATNCSSISVSGTINVNPLPIVSVNNATICAGTSATITATTSSAGTYSYAWIVPSGASSPGNVPSFTTTVAGAYSVIVTNSITTCSSASATGTVTVNPIPVVTVNNATICAGSSATLTAAPSASGTYSYAWTVPAGVANPGNTASFSATTTGTYSVIITNTVTNCSSISASGNLTVNPIPTLTITNPSPVCVPNTVDITATTTGSSPGSPSYWNDNATTIALTNPITVSISGIYYIKRTDTNGCFDVKPVTVVINPSPSATISGQNNFVVCQNGTQPILTFTGSNGTPPYNFSYQIGSGSIQTVATLASSNSASAAIPTSVFGNYTITLLSVQDSSSSSCLSSAINLPNSATVEVLQVGKIEPVDQSLISQIICQGDPITKKHPITPIIFTIRGSSTSAFVTNLPAGLNGVFNSASSQLTISGTPYTPGIFNYIVTTSGSLNGCNSSYSGGTITVNSNDVITLLTPNTADQNVCAGITIQPIAYNLGGGATGGTVTFSPHQPAGISWNLVSNVITITGSTSEVGTFNYKVNSFGICDPTDEYGTIEIKENATVKLVSENASPTVCIDIPLGTPLGTAIKYNITSTTSATMVLTGVLPKGVSFSPITGLFSGTPGESGSFPYTISSSTTCGNVLTGTITVNPLQSTSLLSGTINQIACVNSAIDPINFSLSSGVTGVTIVPDFPPGITSIVNNGVLTISGTPTTAQGNKNYIIKTVGSCGPAVTTNIFFEIKPEATIVFGSNSGAISQSVCQSTAIKPITFTVGGGATGIEAPIWPAGLDLLTLSRDPATGVYTISGNPTANGTFTIPITTTGCVTSETITISNVNTAVTINLTSDKGTDNQTQCQTNSNTSINPIKYLVVGATGVDVLKLPRGITSEYNAGTGELKISGTPTESGIFNYSVTTIPCGIIKTGTLKISTPISITNEVVKDVDCSSINDGAISVTIIGGANSGGLYAINWTGPNGFQQNLTEISGLEAGDYVLSGTDAIGCSIPTMNYTVLGTLPINITLQSSTNVSCNGVLGSANFDITGGSGIYPPNKPYPANPTFKLQYLDPSSQKLVTIIPANNNYYTIKNLKAGLYYLTVVDSKNCSTAPYLFSIYDYSTLKIDAISLDSTLCADTAGKVRVTVTSLDDNLAFYYNSTLVSNVNLGNSIYELSITNPTIPYGVIKVVNGQNCSDTETISTSLMEPELDFTSVNLETNKIVSVNESVMFTNGLTNSTIPAEYNYVVWDFGDNSPYKVFYNPTDVVPNSSGESLTTVFHTYAIDGLFPVTFTVYNSFGCSKSITKIVTVGEGASIIVPTAFSPNQDGINDLFRPLLLGLKEVNMYIYDSFGNLVYEISSETDLLPTDWGWNGIEKTRNTPINGTYRYYIISKTIDDKTIEKAGQFILIK